jgi:hypothetical protein
VQAASPLLYSGLRGGGGDTFGRGARCGTAAGGGSRRRRAVAGLAPAAERARPAPAHPCPCYPPPAHLPQHVVRVGAQQLLPLLLAVLHLRRLGAKVAWGYWEGAPTEGKRAPRGVRLELPRCWTPRRRGKASAPCPRAPVPTDLANARGPLLECLGRRRRRASGERRARQHAAADEQPPRDRPAIHGARGRGGA